MNDNINISGKVTAIFPTIEVTTESGYNYKRRMFILHTENGICDFQIALAAYNENIDRVKVGENIKVFISSTVKQMESGKIVNNIKAYKIVKL